MQYCVTATSRYNITEFALIGPTLVIIESMLMVCYVFLQHLPIIWYLITVCIVLSFYILFFKMNSAVT